MKFSCISIFPQLIDFFGKCGLIEKAIDKGLISINIYNLRDFSKDKHKKVDDRPFGGGPGMVMMADPLFKAVNFIKEKEKGKVILFSAYGKVINQAKIKKMAREKGHLILICGRYEGVDQRFIDHVVDEEISIGKYVLMGGELPAMVLIESISRFIFGVVGDPESVKTDSFYTRDQVGYPQYTKPRNYQGLKVPEVLLSGHHEKIEMWRKIKSKDNKIR